MEERLAKGRASYMYVSRLRSDTFPSHTHIEREMRYTLEFESTGEWEGGVGCQDLWGFVPSPAGRLIT